MLCLTLRIITIKSFNIIYLTDSCRLSTYRTDIRYYNIATFCKILCYLRYNHISLEHSYIITYSASSERRVTVSIRCEISPSER